MAKKAKSKSKSRSKAVSVSSDGGISVTNLGKHPTMFWLILVFSLLIGIVLARWGLHYVAVLVAGIIIFIDTWRRGQSGQPAGLFGKSNNYNFMLASGALMVIVSLAQLVTFAK